jgi:hypothetical protein
MILGPAGLGDPGPGPECEPFRGVGTDATGIGIGGGGVEDLDFDSKKSIVFETDDDLGIGCRVGVTTGPDGRRGGVSDIFVCVSYFLFPDSTIYTGGRWPERMR